LKQMLPHDPQLLLSPAVLTQAVLHCVVVGDPQLMAHALPLHVACPVPDVGPEQPVHVGLPPHPFDGPGKAHPPGQEMAPGSHVQWPPEQICSEPHVWPQVPQFAESLE
jgi:hypothetical protein